MTLAWESPLERSVRRGDRLTVSRRNCFNLLDDLAGRDININMGFLIGCFSGTLTSSSETLVGRVGSPSRRKGLTSLKKSATPLELLT